MSQHHGRNTVTRLRIHARRDLAFICSLSLLAAAPAGACITIPHDSDPTTYETVQLADAIVVATAVASADAATVGARTPEGVRFRIDRVLKGSPPTDFIESSALLHRPAPRSRGYQPRDLSYWHWFDSCGERTMFVEGAHYLLFLERFGNGGWRRLDSSSLAYGDDPYVDDTRWIPTIETYLDIQARFDPMEQLKELERMLAVKQAARSTPQRKAEVRDIADHLQSPTPYKPTPYLLDRYERQADARPFLLRQLALGRHPDATPLFESLLTDPALSAETLGTTIRFFASQGDRRRALDIAEARVLPKLAELDGHDVVHLHHGLTAAMAEDWRSDPSLEARWPRLSFLLTRFVHNALGPGYLTNRFAIDLIGNDFRRWPEATLQAADALNGTVEAWAIAELKKTPGDKAAGRGTPQDPDSLPIRVLVRGYGDEHREALMQVFCQGGSRRALLIDALGEAGQDPDDWLVERMLAAPDLTGDERDALSYALIELEGSRISQRRLSQDPSERIGRGRETKSGWRILLEVLVKGEKFNVATGCPPP
jgi:hypothetical protein